MEGIKHEGVNMKSKEMTELRIITISALIKHHYLITKRQLIALSNWA